VLEEVLLAFLILLADYQGSYFSDPSWSSQWMLGFLKNQICTTCSMIKQYWCFDYYNSRVPLNPNAPNVANWASIH